MKLFSSPTPPRSFLALMLITAVAWSAQGLAETRPDDVKVLDKAEFDALLAHPEELVVIDLRRPDELTSIGGFPVYLSVQVGELASRLDWIPKERTVVTVSNHAGRAKRGAATLIDSGFKVAGAVGAQDYEGAGGTLVKIAAPAPAATQ
jgi:rhodanese-related sulfurtransferase